VVQIEGEKRPESWQFLHFAYSLRLLVALHSQVEAKYPIEANYHSSLDETSDMAPVQGAFNESDVVHLGGGHLTGTSS